MSPLDDKIFVFRSPCLNLHQEGLRIEDREINFDLLGVGIRGEKVRLKFARIQIRDTLVVCCDSLVVYSVSSRPVFVDSSLPTKFFPPNHALIPSGHCQRLASQDACSLEGVADLTLES